MGKINFTRLVIGGLAAGLVVNLGEFILNGIILADDLEALRSGMGLGPPRTVDLVAGLFIIFGYGLGLNWVYVAIRPRFGPGPKTAVIAGLTFWFFAHFLFLTSVLANGMFTVRLTVISILWGVFEGPLAGLVGASLYREDDGAS